MLRHLRYYEPAPVPWAERQRAAALGRVEPFRLLVEELDAAGWRTPAALRDALNHRGVVTPEGSPWSWASAKRLLARLAATE
jgi:hypothetical protein